MQKQIFSELLWHVYLDAQAHHAQLNSILRSSSILTFFVTELESLARKPFLTDDEQTYLLDFMFPCINDILKQLKKEANHDEMRSAVSRHVQDLASKLDGCLTSAQLTQLCEQVDEIWPAASGQLATLMFPRDEPSERSREPEDDISHQHGMAYSRFVRALRKTPEVRMVCVRVYVCVCVCMCVYVCVCTRRFPTCSTSLPHPMSSPLLLR